MRRDRVTRSFWLLLFGLLVAEEPPALAEAAGAHRFYREPFYRVYEQDTGDSPFARLSLFSDGFEVSGVLLRRSDGKTFRVSGEFEEREEIGESESRLEFHAGPLPWREHHPKFRFTGTLNSGTGRLRGTLAGEDPGDSREIEWHPVAAGSGLTADVKLMGKTWEQRSEEGAVRREVMVCFPQFRGDAAEVVRLNELIRREIFGRIPKIDPGFGEEPVAAVENAARKQSPTLAEIEKAIVVSTKPPEEGEYGLSFADISHVRMEPIYHANGIVSLQTYFDIYKGGAHGVQSTSHLTYDLETAQVLRLFGDVLEPGSEPEVRARVEKALRAIDGVPNSAPLSEVEGIMAEELPALDDWFVCPEGIVFSWSPYEIGAYAAWFIRVVMTPEELEPWLIPGNPLEALSTFAR